METNVVQVPAAMPRKWYEIWWDAWRHPSNTTFQDILKEPESQASNGFTYIAITGLIYGIVSLAVVGSRSTYELSGVCGVVFTPFIAMLGLALSAGIYHGIAKLFGGKGDWGDLVYCFAVIQAPTYVFSSVSAVLNLILTRSSLLGLCLTLPALALSIYALVLFVDAIKAVESIGTGAALGTIFVPIIVVIVLGVCIIFVFAVTSTPH